jgi:hypothetical protein
LRVCAHARGAAGGLDITGLRVLLIADVLARAAELRGLQVLTALAFAGRPAERVTAFERAAGALGIHPPVACANSREAEASLGGLIDVHLASFGASVEGGQNGLVAWVGAAQMRRAENQDDATVGEVLAGPGQDPLAVRLAMMSFPWRQSADLAEGVLAAARETLGHWRDRVAEWAESPSKRIPARIAATAQAAFDDLDTVSVLALLRGLALDVGVPAGAKFETFVYADRVLGVDLAREIGQPRAHTLPGEIL